LAFSSLLLFPVIPFVAWVILGDSYCFFCACAPSPSAPRRRHPVVAAMGEIRIHASEYESEEKTEPFSQSEYSARLQSMRVQESFVGSEDTAVHLDELVVPPDKDIRLLVRPLSRSVSPGDRDNCEWLALHAEVAAPAAQQEQKVLAVTQTSKDIKFSVRIPGERLHTGLPKPQLWCELYYDPASDNQILVNKSDVPIALSRFSPRPAASPGIEYSVNPGMTKALSPGTWRIKLEGADVLDFRILEKRPVALKVSPGSASADSLNSSGKRSFVADDDDEVGREMQRVRSADTTSRREDGVIMFLRPTADPLVFPLPTAARPRELAVSNGHPLLNMEKEDTVEIPGGCEIDCYQLTKREPIASTSLSAVFTGATDHPNVPPESVITVKVLKTRSAQTPYGEAMKPDMERNVIRQADIWLREFQSHEDLHHDSIVRLYGGDARYLSLYMEHVDARDLSARGVWRANNSDYFTGTRQDAVRILRDIAGALQYIHAKNLVHNDIKPANILYSRERGAVLCDFGLSTRTNHPASTGGTPYYVPPEFIGRKLRGTPSDAWALGITMLYILRKIPFPESSGRHHRPKPLYWMIADLNKGPSHIGHGVNKGIPPEPSAVAKMQMWLSEINEAKEKLNLKDKLERLVAEMLIPQPHQRATMRRVINELRAEPRNDE